MKGNRAAFILVAGLAALAACSSTPLSTQPALAAAPSWVRKLPEADVRFMYFTGSGESKSGSIAEGEEIARRALLDEIMPYMGVRISSETTATARASLDSYRADLVQTLESSSSGRVAGLRIAERWLSKREGRLNVYLLARYEQRRS